MVQEFIFGYGSLVNRATHDYGDMQPAVLTGWRRVWQHTSLRQLAYLSVEPDAGTRISGVVMAVPVADSALERREASYGRTDVSTLVEHNFPAPVAINTFTIPARIHAAPRPGATLLLSYIDVVVQGYFQVFGEAGVQDFFATTRGWGAQVLDDRAKPQYPRHQRLSKLETALVDHWLAVLAPQME